MCYSIFSSFFVSIFDIIFNYLVLQNIIFNIFLYKNYYNIILLLFIKTIKNLFI